MEQRKKVVLIVLAGVLVIAGIISWLVISEKSDNPLPKETDAVKSITGEVTVNPKSIKVSPPKAKEKTEVSVKAIVITFVERFGTFSNHAKFISLEDIIPMMTSSMESWMQNSYLPTLRREHDPEGFFYSVKTTAPVVRILKEEGNYMEIMVETQRIENNEGQEVKFNQDIKIDLVKSGEEWLVDAAYWQKRE